MHIFGIHLLFPCVDAQNEQPYSFVLRGIKLKEYVTCIETSPTV
jgi:hypothetical protein